MTVARLIHAALGLGFNYHLHLVTSLLTSDDDGDDVYVAFDQFDQCCLGELSQIAI